MTDNATESKAMRVLHIGKYFPPHRGGIETVLRDQMNIQARDEGLQVAAVVHSSERRLAETIEFTELGYRVRRAARWFTVAFAPIAPTFWLSVSREIRDFNPEVIKLHLPNPSAFWLLLLPSARKRTWIVLWHSDVLTDTSWWLTLFYLIYRPLESLVLQNAQKIIATSPPYLETSEPLKRFREKCVVEPPTIDVERIPARFRQAPQPEKGPREGIRALCVGRLTYYKDFGTAISAIARIPEAQLHIVGDGTLKSLWKELAKELGVAHRVVFLGDIADEELWCEYAWCDFVCLPSNERTEAFGLVISEASLFGKPAIVANTVGSGMTWLAEQACDKWATFHAGNPEALIEAIHRIGLTEPSE